MFTKTDLAKFVLSFDESPHGVSLGAQKAFSGTPRTNDLIGRISQVWDKHNGIEFNELWYKQAIAKAIFFKDLDRLVFHALVWGLQGEYRNLHIGEVCLNGKRCWTTHRLPCGMGETTTA